MITLDQLIRERPLIHHGRSRTYGIHPDLAKFLDETVRSGHVTLETGSGLSTLVILRNRVARHFAIAPDADEFEAIRSFCQEHALDTSPLRAVVARSQDYWPSADTSPLDVVLIDGDHAFPMPFIDWFYTADRLKIGGLMIVDDTDLVTGTILADFMRVDPNWQEVLRHSSGRFAIYKKLQHPIHDGRWWGQQPYVANSYPTASVKIYKRRSPGPLERAMTKILPWRLVQVPLRAKIGWPRAE